MINELTAEMKGVSYPFKLIAVPRPMDISTLLDDLSVMASTATGERKRLLKWIKEAI